MTYTPSDGEPIDMSQVGLGPRYGSEDMYRDMGIRPGAKVAIERDGILYHDTVHRVSYTSATPEIVRQLSWWQAALRRLTPKRWRKSLVIREAQPASTFLRMKSDVAGRAEDMRKDVLRTVENLMRDSKP